MFGLLLLGPSFEHEILKMEHRIEAKIGCTLYIQEEMPHIIQSVIVDCN
jgi:hypothetical protein